MKSYQDPQGEELSAADAAREAFQADLSALLDEELDEHKVARTVRRLESDEECQEFFSSIERSMHAHREVVERGLDANASDAFIADTLRSLLGKQVEDSLEDRQLTHRLAKIFYELGKAYVLTGSDPDWRQRVFDRPEEVDRQRAAGRGFVDGVAERSEATDSRLDWSSKRHLLNGTLEKIQEPFEKARRMLQECLSIEPDFEMAILWLANLDRLEGHPLRAARGFERVFEEGISTTNRAHAAMQLGKGLVAEGDYKEALRYFRWVGLCGELSRDRRFFPAGFNVGLCLVNLGKTRQALSAFRNLLDTHPDQAPQIAGFLAGSAELQAQMVSLPGFLEALYELCPELFQPAATQPDPSL